MTIEEVAEKLAEATGELRSARAELHEERRWRRWLLWTLGGFAAFLILVLLAPGWGLVSVANENRENGDLLVECTTPGPEQPSPDKPGTGHDCFDRGSEATAKAVQQIDVNQRCTTQEAINQTIASLSKNLPHVQLINPNECFKEEP